MFTKEQIKEVAHLCGSTMAQSDCHLTINDSEKIKQNLLGIGNILSKRVPEFKDYFVQGYVDSAKDLPLYGDHKEMANFAYSVIFN